MWKTRHRRVVVRSLNLAGVNRAGRRRQSQSDQTCIEKPTNPENRSVAPSPQSLVRSAGDRNGLSPARHPSVPSNSNARERERVNGISISLSLYIAKFHNLFSQALKAENVCCGFEQALKASPIPDSAHFPINQTPFLQLPSLNPRNPSSKPLSSQCHHHSSIKDSPLHLIFLYSDTPLLGLREIFQRLRRFLSHEKSRSRSRFASLESPSVRFQRLWFGL